MDEGAISDGSFPGRGLIRGEVLARCVRQRIGGRLIEPMPLPLRTFAAGLDSGQRILVRAGGPGVAVRASSAAPAVFRPVRIGARDDADAGMVAPVPVSFARQIGAERAIAVEIVTPPNGAATGGLLRVLLQTVSITGRGINPFEPREADAVIRLRLPGVSSADFAARSRSVQAGREAAPAALPEPKRRWVAAATIGNKTARRAAGPEDTSKGLMEGIEETTIHRCRDLPDRDARSDAQVPEKFTPGHSMTARRGARPGVRCRFRRASSPRWRLGRP
jgi:NTE family protein